MIAGAIIKRLQDQIQDDSDETKADILSHLNFYYIDLAGKHLFRTLLTEVPTQGSVLPADLVRPHLFRDDTDSLYFESGLPMRYSSNKLYNWYMNLTAGDPLTSGADGVISANATAFTSAAGAFTAAMVGEYIRIGQNLGIYKIAAVPSATALTLQDGFRGDAETAAYYQVRPEGTLALTTHDNQGVATSPVTLSFWYLRRPLPIYNDYDSILLPGNCEALYIRVIQSLLKTGKYTNDAFKEMQSFEEAWAEMVSLSPIPKVVHRAKDALGRVAMYGRRRHTHTSSNFHANDGL